MATKKKSASKSTALVPWTERFAKYAQQTTEQVKNIGGSSLSVSFGRGSITIGDAKVPGGRLECVILGSCALNRFYKKDWDPNDKQPPDCYAFALVSDDPEMRPHPQASDKQSEDCASCPQNVFGSAKTGRGKACANTIRLGLITAKDAEDADSAAAAELATAGVSPTNRAHYAAYAKALLEDHGRPPWSVVTEISSYDDPKTQIRLEFKMVETIDDDDVLKALEKRFLSIQDKLQTPYAAPVDRKAANAKGEKAVAASRKFVGGKGRK